MNANVGSQTYIFVHIYPTAIHKLIIIRSMMKEENNEAERIKKRKKTWFSVNNPWYSLQYLHLSRWFS